MATCMKSSLHAGGPEKRFARVMCAKCAAGCRRGVLRRSTAGAPTATDSSPHRRVEGARSRRPRASAPPQALLHAQMQTGVRGAGGMHLTAPAGTAPAGATAQGSETAPGGGTAPADAAAPGNRTAQPAGLQPAASLPHSQRRGPAGHSCRLSSRRCSAAAGNAAAVQHTRRCAPPATGRSPTGAETSRTGAAASRSAPQTLLAPAGTKQSPTETATGTNSSSRAGAALCRGAPAAGQPPCTGRPRRSWRRRRRCPPGAPAYTLGIASGGRVATCCVSFLITSSCACFRVICCYICRSRAHTQCCDHLQGSAGVAGGGSDGWS